MGKTEPDLAIYQIKLNWDGKTEAYLQVKYQCQIRKGKVLAPEILMTQEAKYETIVCLWTPRSRTIIMASSMGIN